MKLSRILTLLVAPVLVGLLAFSCSEEDGVKASLKDVSNRITGFNTDVTGAGSTLVISGSELDKVTQIFVGNYVVKQSSFQDVSSSSITILVPTQVGLGDNRVILVFPGNQRAFATIPVVPVPLIGSISPAFGLTDAVISIAGSGFDNVSGVKINGTSAEITAKTATSITFKVPAGATTGKITLDAVTGVVTSTATFVACSSDPQPICVPAINLNAGFELGTGDVFTNWNKYNGGTLMVETKVAAEVHGGLRAMKVNVNGTQGGTQEWRIQLASDEFDTTIGSVYNVEGWFKATVGSSVRYSTASPAPGSAQYQGGTAIATTWTKSSWSFTANGTKTRIVLDMGGATNTVYFVDDVTVKKQ